MLLAIDVGNSNIVLGLFDGTGDNAQIVADWRVRTDPQSTADELALTVRGLLGPLAGRITGISGLSTVPSVLRQLRIMVERYWPEIPHILVEPGVKTGVPLHVDNPKEVGTDRVVNALAAHRLYGTAGLVVDFGTSTSVDAISERGEFLGGAIAPGIEISVDALAGSAAALRKVEMVRPRSVVGKNTVECLQSGFVYGFAGQVDGIIRRIRKELNFTDANSFVIATGGLATLVIDECDTVMTHHPHLTISGLRMVFERNQASSRRTQRGSYPSRVPIGGARSIS
ncbi:type III pantothenate kinase [Hoyosella rhizosphaerae]|uniref:Type III pantothenate kinase n=1 Tax=Hoyosella rhizosphaerae TaxID=1755582 RepID=A0A916XK21_9ACTN|nr:type III pantothenate kinase [Hoyosella rhizosphaerae]MBN4925314.1 type III pantothenate kinase [Hoyosella rhizosphaerae]GGC76281.1 type III pantothenate kinase [Hoyosella rhizosphaerae]